MNDWRDVWKAIDARRIALGWSKQALYDNTGTSEGTYRKMKIDGTPIAGAHKISAICHALLWTQDSVDRILDGLLPQADPIYDETGPTPATNAEGDLRTFRAHIDSLDEIDPVFDQVDRRLAMLQFQITGFRDMLVPMINRDMTVDVQFTLPNLQLFLHDESGDLVLRVDASNPTYADDDSLVTAENEQFATAANDGTVTPPKKSNPKRRPSPRAEQDYDGNQP